MRAVPRQPGLRWAQGDRSRQGAGAGRSVQQRWVRTAHAPGTFVNWSCTQQVRGAGDYGELQKQMLVLQLERELHQLGDRGCFVPASTKSREPIGKPATTMPSGACGRASVFATSAGVVGLGE
jgi:hypothetical protein